MIIIFILISHIFEWAFALQGDTMLKELGEKQYYLLKGKSTFPLHSDCWHNAIKSLKNNCDKLNDHEHSLLALRLTNCFLEDSGHVTYDCHIDKSENRRKKCINEMSDRAFGVYNEFYTHTTHMCFYLNHELWQTETEKTIKHLYAASTRMTEQLMEASVMQGSMLESQKEGLKLQNELIIHGQVLEDVLKSSSESVNSMVSDFKETSKDQQALLYEIFSYMRTFQDWIIGEVSWFQSIIYYTVACILCALFSSSKRTVDSRITIFTILSFNVIIERMLVQYNVNTISPEDKIHLIYCTWCLRKCALLLCFCVLLYSYYVYKDEHVENHRILKRIEKQLHSLQEAPPTFRYRTRLAVKRLNNFNEVNHKHSTKSLDLS